MVRSMFHALVLIKARPAVLPTLGPTLAAIDGVTEAYSVTGEWDFVAVVRLRRHDELAERIAGQLALLDGIERTETMVAFEVFSQHDLEAMFSIGAD
jgi:DNA-binding Lrp family transcriptional regulator